MSPEEYKAEALRQSKSKKEGKGWDAMGAYDSKGNKKAETKVDSGPTPAPEDTKKVGKGNIDVSGYEKDNIYDLQAEKHKEKDMRLEKKQDKRNERMKKTDEYIEKNKAVKGETGKNIGRFFKRVGGKIKKSMQRGATNINRKRQVKQETKINELEAKKAEANKPKEETTLGKENPTKSQTKGKGKKKENTEDKSSKNAFKQQMLKESLDALGTHHTQYD